MKRINGVIVLSFVFLSAFAFIVVAASNQAGTNTVSTSFIDVNGDGVCDNSTNSGGKGNGYGKGAKSNFVDADGDGVCDNAGKGQGTKKGFNNKGQVKPNFVDANGDGVCDNAGTCPGAQKRNGNGSNGKASFNK